MNRVVLLAVAALAVMPQLATAQERERGGGGGRPEGGQRPGGGNPGQRPGGGGPGGQPGRPGGGGPGGGQPAQRPGGGNFQGGQRPAPQAQPGRPGGDFQRPGRPGGDVQRPGGPGNDNRPGFGGNNRPGRPGGDFQRPSNYRPPAGYWHGNSWARPPISWGGGYRYPAGYGYRRWSTGLILPALFFSSAYYFTDYGALGLYAPPYGYHWVRYGPDLLLVQNYTRRIVDVRYGVFR